MKLFGRKQTPVCEKIDKETAQPLAPATSVGQSPGPVETGEQAPVPAENISPHAATPEPTLAEQPVAAPETTPLTAPPAASASNTHDIMLSLQALHVKADHIEKGVAGQVADLLANYQQTVDLAAKQHETIGVMARNQQALEDQAFRENVLKPMLRDLMLMTDSMAAARKHLAGSQGSDPLTQALQVLDAAENELLGLLARQGVTPIHMPDASFDPRRQKVIRVEQGDAPSDMAVMAVIRRGFEWDGKILRPEEVILRRTKQTKKESA